MNMRPSGYAGRLAFIPETDAEREMIRQVCIGVNDKKDVWTMDGCLLNLVAINKCFNVTLPFTIAANVAGDWEPDVRLFDYQIGDTEKLRHLPYPLNANPMGYGKTVEALQWAKARGYRRILIVCPKSTRYQWQAAVWEWYDPELEVGVAPEVLKGDIIITNYEQIIRNNYYGNILWDCIIVDEIHRIRNVKSKISTVMRTLRSKGRIGLTGTPIMNKPDDLWGICLFLKVNYLGGSYWNFVNQYCRIEEDYWGKKIGGATDDPLKIAILKETLDLFWVRNPQNMVGNGITESYVDLEMYPAQKKLYTMVRRLAIEELDKVGVSIANAMVQTMKLQQLTSDPRSFESYTDGNPKFDWIADLLQDNPELKICVFSKFKKAIISLQQELGEEICVTIHGDISAKNREINKNRFITEPETKVIAGTIGAMSEGIDGLQKVCHTVIFIDCDWNPESNNQATARIFRQGQEYRVNVYILSCIATIDKYIGKVASGKMEDIKELIWREH